MCCGCQVESHVRLPVGGPEERNIPQEIVFPVRRPGKLERLNHDVYMTELLLVDEMTSLAKHCGGPFRANDWSTTTHFTHDPSHMTYDL